MASIVPSDLAPDEQIHYSFGSGEFDLAAGGSFETDDRDLLSNARTHPWLHVVEDAQVILSGQYVEQVKPEDDPLSSYNSHANDPAYVNVDGEVDAPVVPVAIDAGQDQSVVTDDGGLPETLAEQDAAEEEAASQVNEPVVEVPSEPPVEEPAPEPEPPVEEPAPEPMPEPPVEEPAPEVPVEEPAPEPTPEPPVEEPAPDPSDPEVIN